MSVQAEGAVVDRLVALSRELGRAGDEFALLGEGNASAALPDGRLAVKASGAQLGKLKCDDLVTVSWGVVLEHLDDELDSAAWREVMQSATGPVVRRPSIETPVHAVAVGLCDASWVAHTHPISVNSVICSTRPELLARPLFPDQVVICGPAYALVPYVDPGQALGRTVRNRVLEHRGEHGTWPKVLLLEQHGLVALGSTAEEVVAITLMMCKAASIVVGSASVGEPRHLPINEVLRLSSREDEKARRRLLV